MEYRIDVLQFFALRFIPLAIVWFISLRFVRWNEFSNAHINWARRRVEPGSEKDGSQWAASIAIMATLLVAANCFIRKDLFTIDILRIGMAITTAVLGLSFYFLFDEEVERAHRKCVLRNQKRLDAVFHGREIDEAVLFERHFDIQLEPEWRHVVVMCNWLLQSDRSNILSFEERREHIHRDAEIIEFPHRNNKK